MARSTEVAYPGSQVSVTVYKLDFIFQVFLVSRNKGRLLKDNEMFIVGRRTFKWKYASQNGMSRIHLEHKYFLK